jgi:NAD(P)-dependent dehydrogenase (short-subunit alcohol dehydrogenase family)
MSGAALLITGSSGIAEATALLAAQRGYRIFLASKDGGQCNALCGRIPGAGWHAADLSREQEAESSFQAALTHCGRIDALFNIAGVSGRAFGDGPVHECSAEGWDLTVGNNLRSAFLMCRAAIRYWIAAGTGGAILNTSSVLASAPAPRHFATHAYAASKGALESLTVAMAATYARHGIRVNAVAPGLVRTPMTTRAQSDPDILAFVRSKQPLSDGILEASDIARAALFLLSDEARHITGQILPIDGGWRVTG